MRMATPSTPNEFFALAVKEYASDASTLYEAGRTKLANYPTLPPGNTEPDPTQKRAQQAVSGGLKQIDQAAAMDAKQQGFVGYASVVALMGTTATMAANVRTKIETLMGIGTPSGAELDAIRVLNNTLASLAALSPAAVWTHPVPDDVEKK